MEITITLRDTEGGQEEIEETRLPFSDESLSTVTTARVLPDELRKCANGLGKLDEIE